MSKTTRVVTFHYTLTDKTGAEIDSSRHRNDPMVFLEGSGQIIPGLDSELQKMSSGDKKVVKVPAADAYGEIDAQLVFNVSRDRFPPGANIQVGDRFRANANDQNGPIFSVTKISLEEITVDGNHPLAGQDLTFDVEIVDARNATQEEMEHGHAHGPGGHHGHSH